MNGGAVSVAISVRGLRKSYGEMVALRGIDLEVEPGEVYGFIGPNGSGKTTTMRILMDLIRPSAGSVMVLGEDPRKAGPSLRRRVGYLPGDFHLNGAMKVGALLAYFARLSQRPDAREFFDLADRLGLPVAQKVSSLSRGNRQKLALVQAFAHEPDVLVLDEPTSSLDPLLQLEFRDLTWQARDRGAAVFLSSHVLSQVEQVADRVGVLSEGRVLMESTIADIRARMATAVRATFAEPCEGEEFRRIPGVTNLVVGDSEVAFDLEGPVDPVVKAMARHMVTDVEFRRLDLEAAVIRLYASHAGDTEGVE